MAEKGTYGAYAQQPQPRSGQFEGANAFAQMAAVKTQRKAASIERQRKLQKEGREAIKNAAKLSQIDMSKFDQSVYSVVSKMLDNYGDKVVDAASGLEDGYSYRDELKLAEMASKFKTDISSLMGISNSIKKVRDMNLDPILGVEAINGMSNFLNGIPEMAEKFNPDDMTVDGQNIVQMYNEMVPKDKLIPFVDTSEAFDLYAEKMLDKPKTVETIEGNQTVVREYRSYEPRVAQSAFNTYFSEESREFQKESTRLLLEHERMPEGQAKKDFAARYLEKSSKGDYIVTPDSMYNYVQDNILEPRTKKLKSRTEKEPDELTQTQKDKIAKQSMTNLRRIEVINEAATPEGMVGLLDKEINVDGVAGTIVGGGLSYNAMTGEQDIAVSYTVSDKNDNVHTFTTRFPNNEAGLQSLSNSIFDEFDYIQTKRVESKNTDRRLDPPRRAKTLDQRAADIESQVNNSSDAIHSRMTHATDTGDVREPNERIFEYIAQPFAEVGEPNEALINFMATYLGVKDDFSGNAGLPDGKEYKLSEFDQSKMDNQTASQHLGKLTMVARRMKASGSSDEEIMKTLVDQAKNGITFELDPVKEEISKIARGNARVTADYEARAQELLKQGLSDDQVISELQSWTPGDKKKKDAPAGRVIEDKGKKVTVPDTLIESLKAQNPGLSDQDYMDWIKAQARKHEKSVEEIITILSN